MIEEFEVKGPHEEVLEGEGAGRGFNNRVAVLTAIMATIGALFSYNASFTLGEAIMWKNEASIKKTEASDQWNFFQSKSNKLNIAELSAKLTTGKDHDESKNNVQRYDAEKKEIQKNAERIEKLAHEADLRSEKFLATHNLWSPGTTLLQIAISLAAMALLMTRKWLLYGSLTCAAVGIGFGIMAWLGL